MEKRVYTLVCASILALFIDSMGQESIRRIPIVSSDRRTTTPGWSKNTKQGKSDISILNEGAGIVQFNCLNSSFSLQRDTQLDPREFPIVRWNWKVSALPPKGDLRRNETNDQVLQLFFLFNRGGSGYKAISYVWDSNAPVNTITHEKWNFLVYKIDVKVVVVESGSRNIGKLIWNQRNIFNDYRALYHETPRDLVGIRLQSNCQHTNASALGYFSELEFKK